MRDVVFLVADQTMQQILEGFFGRDQFHRSLDCDAFTIDAHVNRDVFTASGLNDPGCICVATSCCGSTPGRIVTLW